MFRYLPRVFGLQKFCFFKPFSTKPNLIPNLLCISPIDGRYHRYTKDLSEFFSEYALMKYRVYVELKWFKFCCDCNIVKDAELSHEDVSLLKKIVNDFNVEDAEKIKEIEGKTNHDLKSVEYFLKDKFIPSKILTNLKEFLHLCCTSEDINNISYGLIVQNSIYKIMIPALKCLRKEIGELVSKTSQIPMMAKTHGQPATPTTMGKELANFVARMNTQIIYLENFKSNAKFNGAVGNFNAHYIAFPDLDWIQISQQFVIDLGLQWNPYSTQIESHDGLAEVCRIIEHLNTILIGLCRDLWMYISSGYFKLKNVKDEVGSSTMPHKVNPINFENAEGNLGVSNALLCHFAAKLPISRMQRDLSDSTVLRNIGSAFGYSLIAYKYITEGFKRLEIDEKRLAEELENHYELLAEPVQTVMRKYKMEAPYEKLKEFTRGKIITKDKYLTFLQTLKLPEKEKEILKKLTPGTYIGIANQLAERLKIEKDKSFSCERCKDDSSKCSCKS